MNGKPKDTKDTLILWRWALGIAMLALIGMIFFSIQSVINATRGPERVKPPVESPDAQKVTGVEEQQVPASAPVVFSTPLPADNHASFGEYENYESRKNLEKHLEMQTDTLREEAEAQRVTGEKRSLALSEEEIKVLEESGNLIY